MALIMQHGLQCFHYGHQLQATQRSPFHKGGSWSPPPLYIYPKGTQPLGGLILDNTADPPH